MESTIKKTIYQLFALGLLIGLTNCNTVRNANNSQKGAVIGATSGAVIGAIIGNNVGKKGKGGELGAIIGGVVGGSAGAVIGKKMDKQAQEIEEEIPGATVERVEESIVVTFDENSGVNFATNKYDINSVSQETLDKLAGIFMEYPETKILVVGHTDSSGADEYNMTLSEKRANAVSNYLGTHGVSSSRITTRWFGETQPISDNSTAEGRAKNRRVNIAIMPNEKMVEEAEKEAGGN